MKILFQYVYGSGGALANLVRLVDAVANVAPDAELVIMCSPESALKELDYRDNVSIEVYGEESWKVFWRFRLGFSGLKAAVEKHRPDIVWSVNTGAFGTLSCPQVVQLNNPYHVYPLSMAKHHPRGRVAVMILRQVFAQTLKHSSTLVCQTQVMADSAVRLFNYDGRVEVIGKAVGNDAHRQSEVSDAATESGKRNRFNFGYVATGYPHKNHAVLLEACRTLANQRNNFQLHLSLTREEIISLGGAASASLIDQRVVVPHGWLNPASLPDFYRSLDACVMPSLTESLSSAHLEAMAFALPQINANLPYAHELCGNAALYADPLNGEDWATQMAALMDNAALQDRLGNAGAARHAAMPKEWSDVAREWVTLLQSVASAS
ncbi:glycosyltransferase [Qipengyuania flava]|uniref:glycosyltransferase n=1 Tax=Qipengyuania flava TaxID=192812 RepID=UPI0009ECC8CF